MTFDAGSIDARLTLDRSAFTRELREARLEAERFEQNEIEIRVKLQDVLGEIFALNEEVNSIDGRSLEINVEVHDGPLTELQAKIAALSSQSIFIDVDASTTGIDALEARIATLSGKRIDIVAEGSSSGLARLQSQIDAMNGRYITVAVDTDTSQLDILELRLQTLTGTDVQVNLQVDGLDELIALRTLLEEMTPFTIEVRADTSHALGELIALDAIVRDMHATVEVDVDAGKALGELAALEAIVQGMDGQNIDIDVRASGAGGAGAAGSLSRMQAIIAGILLLAPLIPAVIGPAAAAVGGLASSLTAVAGGLGVVAAGVGGTVLGMVALQTEIQFANQKLAGMTEGSKEYKKQQQEIDNLNEAMATKYGKVSTAFDGVKDAYASFQDAIRPESNKLLATGLDIVAALLPRLTPIFKTFAGVLQDAFGQISDFMGSGEGQRMLDFFNEIGGLSLDALLKVVGNLLLIFGRLFEAFGPFGVEILNGLAGSLGNLADQVDGLGQKKGFQDFLTYAREVGPRVLELLNSIWQAALSLGEALAPLGGPALTAFTALFDLIANAPTGVLTTLIVLIGGLYLAFVGINAAIAIWNGLIVIWSGVTTVASGVMAAWTAIVWLFNAAWAVSPIGVIIIGIVALVAALIFAYKHFETFRNVVDTVVHAVVGFFQWLWDVLFGHSIIPDMVKAFDKAFTMIKDFILTPIKLAVKLVMVAFDVLKAYFTTIFQIYKTIISAALDVIKALFRGDFNAIPGIIRDALGRVWDILRGVGDRALKALGNLGNLLKDAGRALIQGLIDGIQAMFKPLGDKLGAVGGFIKDHFPGSPAKTGPLSAHGGYHMVHAGSEIIRQVITGFDDQDPALASKLTGITNKIAATSAGISARIGADGRMAPGQARGGMTVVVNNPSRMRTDESYEAGLKRVAVRQGYTG